MLVLPQSVIDDFEDGNVLVRVMLVCELTSGAQGIWNDAYDVTLESVTYTAVGGNVKFSEIPGSSGLDADNLGVTISGVDPAALNLVGASDWHQRPAVLYAAYLNEDRSIKHREALFSGFVDTAFRDDKVGEPAVVEFSLEGNNRELDRASRRTYSNADQLSVGGANDGWLKYIAAANADVDIYWGRNGPKSPAG